MDRNALLGGQPILTLKTMDTEVNANLLSSNSTPAERLSALRAELAARNLDGFLVPRSDEHQGEYVSERAERLAWLSGFSGSAGIAAVSIENAAVFVDGRYTLQAEEEVDGDTYERRHLTDQPLADWIAENMDDGQHLGYDPWLLTPTQVNNHGEACRKAGVKLVAVDGNPIDAIWTDQPEPSMATVTFLEHKFTGESSVDKRRRMAKQIAKDGANALVLTAPDSIAWLFNIRGGDVPFTPFALSFAVLHADGSAEWFIDTGKLEAGLAEKLGGEITLRGLDELGAGLDELGENKKTVRADPDTAAAWVHNRLTKVGANVQRKDDPCQLAKARKNETQQQGMRDAHLRDGVAVVRFLAWLAEVGPSGAVTEISAAEKLEGLRRLDPLFRGLSFPTISGAGPNGAIVHYRVTQKTNRKLEPGSMYLVDSGAQYPDGTTDITRTIAIGAPSDAMRHHFTLVLKGSIALARAVFPKGTTGSQLDVLARQALWRSGLDYDHGTGHGVGSFLSVHEGPMRISKTPSRVALETGMVISNEPGFYLNDAYGIRIENLVMVKQAPGEAGKAGFIAFDTLTLAPIDRALVMTELLDSDEIAWFDTYHQRVRVQLSPLVEDSVAVWLAGATAPLTSGGTS